MESRQMAGHAPARLSAEDSCRRACDHWLGIEEKRERLLTAWGRLDRKVTETTNWRDLTVEERDRHPTTAIFADLSARLEALTEDSQIGFEAVLAALPTSWPGAIKSLEVAQRLICRGDFEESITLIERVLKLMRAGVRS